MSKKRLWVVEVGFKVVVFAESEDDALRIAESDAADEISNATLWAEPVADAVEIPDEWLTARPYGQKWGSDLTCLQILEEAK